MPHIEVVPEDKAEGRLKEVYEGVRSSRGAIANILKVHSLDPDALQAHLDLYLATSFGNLEDGLGRRERELIAVVVSLANECDYCVAHHADALSRYMREPGMVAQVRDDWRSAELTHREKVLCEFADQLTRNPSTVRADHVEALRKQGYSDAAILQAVQTMAYFNYVNRMALGLGVEVDDVGKSYDY